MEESVMNAEEVSVLGSRMQDGFMQIQCQLLSACVCDAADIHQIWESMDYVCYVLFPP